MDIRRSSATSANHEIKKTTPKRGQGNAKWLAARVQPGAVVLVGGASLEHFRLRVAQSHLRHDLLPSFWSVAGVAATSTSFLTVPITVRDASLVPVTNGVESVRFSEIDDTARYPNVAVIHFAEPSAPIVGNVRRLMEQRSALDLPSLMLPWLAFMWGAGSKRNPLIEGGAIAVSRARADGVRHGRDRDDAGVVVGVDVSRGDLAIGAVVARLLPEDGGRERRPCRHRQDGRRARGERKAEGDRPARRIVRAAEGRRGVGRVRDEVPWGSSGFLGVRPSVTPAPEPEP